MYDLIVELPVFEHAVEEVLPGQRVVKGLGPQSQDIRSADIDAAVDEVAPDLNFGVLQKRIFQG